MGTNFYRAGFRNADDPAHHVGKRSAAGAYCWDCGITLCKSGDGGIHRSKADWFFSCPKCGKSFEYEGPEGGAAARELGFNRLPFGKKVGVKSCSSFSFAMEPEEIASLGEIEDEYGRRYTAEEFKVVLEECPIRFMHVGERFS